MADYRGFSLGRFRRVSEDRLREQVSEELAEYEAPEAPDTEAESQAKSEAKSEGAEVVLSYNFGIPLIVVVTRSDTSNALESPKTLGWSETIEAYLRNECLPFGAAIVYTAAGSPKFQPRGRFLR
ncbi:unnamed protein product [Effrenium voratum]|uniref:Uncharacterized protein n=1 Tax=Effrenium voratum TaxID=2562239 RepID=A0AA36JF47_9DINO|nr:unnamed protein product [Effrenium voratum]